jgi:transposase InsO family protein
MPYIPIVTKSWEDCVLAKQHKKIVPKKNMIQALRQNKLLHTNLCGPFKHTWLGGSKYFLTITYDFSRKMWIFFLLQKSEAFEKFKTLIKIIDRSKGKHIITLHSNKGGEFLSTTFNKFLEAKGIKRELTTTKRCSKTEELNDS